MSPHRRSWIAAVSLAIAVLVASPAIADADASAPSRSERPTSSSYSVSVGKARLSGVKLTNMETKINVIEYQDGDDLHLRKRPGRAKVADPVLHGTGPMPPMLKTWWVDTLQGKVTRHKVTVSVTAAGTGKRPTIRHVLLQTFPKSVSVNPAKNTWKMELAAEQALYFQ